MLAREVDEFKILLAKFTELLSQDFIFARLIGMLTYSLVFMYIWFFFLSFGGFSCWTLFACRVGNQCRAD